MLINGSNNVVGDSAANANHFEGLSVPGITVASGTGNSLLFNTYLRSSGIDLGGDGRTNNDAGDRDAGPNNLQNYPLLSNVLRGGSTTIQGSLNSTSNTAFRVLFITFNRANGDFRFLGETTVATDAGGDASIDVVVDGTAEIGEVVFATATDPGGSTSEFSAGFPVLSGVANEDAAAVPESFALHQNYPNPFNPNTTIGYAVPKAGPVRLAVYDLLGRVVAVLVDDRKAAGRYDLVFDARGLPSGTYFYTMRGDGFTQTRHLMLLK